MGNNLYIFHIQIRAIITYTTYNIFYMYLFF